MRSKLFLLFFLFFLIISLPLLLLRLQRENQYRNIEICLDQKAVEKLCQREMLPFGSFREKAGSLGLHFWGWKEDTLKDWINRNEVIYYSREEIFKNQFLKLKPFIHWPTKDLLFFKDRQKKNDLEKILSLQLNRKLSKVNFSQRDFILFPEGYDEEELGLGGGEKGVIFYPKAENSLLVKDISLLGSRGISGVVVDEGEFAQLLSSPSNEYFENLYVLENVRIASLPLSLSSQIVRAHSISEKELQALWKKDNQKSQAQKEEMILYRLLRAAKERNIRFFYLFPLPEENIAGNLEFLVRLKSLLEKNNFKITAALPVPPFGEKLIKLRLFLALFVAIFFPVLALSLVSLRPRFLLSQESIGGSNLFLLSQGVFLFLILSLFSLGSGLVIAGLGASSSTLLKLSPFPGIKIALVLPILIVANKFYPWNVWKNKNMPAGYFILMMLIMGAGLVYLLRSGNNNSFVFPGEEKFRNLLEIVFTVRPRTKEFLFGHPLMLFGLWLWLRAPSTEHRAPFLDGRLFIILGMVGQVSIVNSFCHLHTPAMLSLVRSLHGLWLGLVVGMILIGIYKVVVERKLNSNIQVHNNQTMT